MECNMLGDKLRWLRQYAGYPQWRVAEIIGKDRSTYAYYETGRVSPSYPTPVSYTHLDVYKRQGVEILVKHIQDRNDFADIYNLNFFIVMLVHPVGNAFFKGEWSENFFQNVETPF